MRASGAKHSYTAGQIGSYTRLSNFTSFCFCLVFFLSVLVAEFGYSDCCPDTARNINCRPGIEYAIVVIVFELLFTSFPVFFCFVFIIKCMFEHRKMVVFLLNLMFLIKHSCNIYSLHSLYLILHLSHIITIYNECSMT